MAVAGSLAWLFLTDSGSQILESWKTDLKEKGKELAANFLSEKTGVPASITKPATDAVVD